MTVGPIKRLNVAIRSAYPEKESISFGSFKVIKTEDSRFIHKLGPYKLEKPIRRIILQQRGF